ncbi:MAG: MBL fold metallo-hydrolase, partial [Sedimenticolaceae bacterium]
PGDSLVWIPQERVVFSGDVVYIGRMLGVMPHSRSSHWIEAFETMASLEPLTVVPGHGPPADLARARADSLDYLVFLRETVGNFMENSGDITQIGTLDQSRFAHLVDYESLKGRNAQQVFQEMEWE